MLPLTSMEILGLWEGGAGLHSLDRAQLVLGAAFPDTPRERLADWTLGRRNRALAEVRCRSFGSRLQGWTECPECGDKLEFEMDARAIAQADVPDDDLTVFLHGHTFRLPTSRDLALFAQHDDPPQAVLALLKNCRMDSGEPPAWSEPEIDDIGEKMALADPLAETRLNLNCPACDCRWEQTLDIAAFLWTEIEARARKLLWEVHDLANAYGWTEKEILSLSDTRRRSYLEMIRT